MTLLQVYMARWDRTRVLPPRILAILSYYSLYFLLVRTCARCGQQSNHQGEQDLTKVPNSEKWMFPGGSDNKESACKARDPGSDPGSGTWLLANWPWEGYFIFLHQKNGHHTPPSLWRLQEHNRAPTYLWSSLSTTFPLLYPLHS